MKLEDFIQQHKAGFEEEGPSPRVWAALEKELPVRSSGRVVRMMARHWWKAAIIVALVANAGLLLKYLNAKQEVAYVIPEMAEMQVYYTTKIEQKLDELNKFPAGQLGLDSTTMQELQLRNDTYKMLEKELAANPGNERIRAAMVRYYQMKLELLDRIINEQEKHHESTTPSKTYDAI
ncbi:hypothetical protein ACWKWU_20355 [Chitinophaga lutea]